MAPKIGPQSFVPTTQATTTAQPAKPAAPAPAAPASNAQVFAPATASAPAVKARAGGSDQFQGAGAATAASARNDHDADDGPPLGAYSFQGMQITNPPPRLGWPQPPVWNNGAQMSIALTSADRDNDAFQANVGGVNVMLTPSGNTPGAFHGVGTDPSGATYDVTLTPGKPLNQSSLSVNVTQDGKMVSTFNSQSVLDFPAP